MLLCVSFGLTNQVWNYLEFCLSKTYFVFECLKGEWLKILILGKLGFKTCVLEKHFISYSCIFISYIQCFEVCFQNSGYFSKKMFEQVKIEFFLKLDSRCSIDRKTGSINRTRQRLTKIFNKNFDWSKNTMDQSKIWIKLLVLKKKKTEFLKTYLKALNIRNKNAWVWDEMLF